MREKTARSRYKNIDLSLKGSDRSKGCTSQNSSNSVNPDTLATVAAKDEELRHFDTEQAFSEASVDEEIYIKSLEKNQKFTGAVRLLLNMIYGLIQVEICWFNIFHYNRMAIGFEQ